MRRLHALSTVSLFVLCACASGFAATPVTMLEIGAAAPDFELPGVDGRKHSLADYAKADVLAVVFTCNHCPTAQAYEDRIIRLTSDYKDKGVAVVAISPNDPKGLRLDELGYTEMSDTLEEMKVRARDKKFNFPYLYDGDTQEVSRAYGPTATPQVFVFDKGRKLCYVGRIDDSKKPENIKVRDLRIAIDALLAGKSVPVAKTKAFGCSIKWAGKRSLVRAALEKWAGEEVTLNTIDLAGVKELMERKSDKLRVINFWATWCVPCVEEFPELVSIHRMYRKRPFELITISVDDPDAHERVHTFLKKQQASTTNFRYSSDDVYGLIEAVDKDWQGSFPYTVVIAPGGKVLYKKEGIIDPAAVKKAIVDHLGRYKY